MADDNLEEFATTTQKNLFKAAGKIAQVWALKSQDWAPRGWSNQLKDNIRAEQPRIRKNDIYAVVKAFAADEDGNNYALTQHDDVWGHFNRKDEKALQGYASVGTGNTRKEKYWSGYHKSERHYKYATKFFEKGLKDSDKEIDIILNNV